MKIKKQREKLEIINFDVVGGGEKKKNIRKNGKLLPPSIRCIISGPSSCGKTNLMFNLVFAENGLKFRNLYIFSKSLHQPKYKLLTQVMSGCENEIGFYPFTENEEVCDPNDIAGHSLIIFDDVICEKQDNIRKYFAMGRHNDLDVFYLAQTYSHIPKHLIRDNANLIVLFKQDELNLRHVYADHVNTDMTLDDFKAICSQAWNGEKNHSFLVIDKDSDMKNGRYRIGFDKFIDI